MAYVLFNDDAATRVNLDQVVSYTVNLTPASEAIDFKLSINNTTTILELNLLYTGGAAEDEQVVADLNFLDHIADVVVARVAVDAT